MEEGCQIFWHAQKRGRVVRGAQSGPIIFDAARFKRTVNVFAGPGLGINVPFCVLPEKGSCRHSIIGGIQGCLLRTCII